jgi:hypothetical protein
MVYQLNQFQVNCIIDNWLQNKNQSTFNDNQCWYNTTFLTSLAQILPLPYVRWGASGGAGGLGWAQLGIWA